MNLDQAIKHCIHQIEDQFDNCNNGCAVEHAQLLLWLLELKERREADIK